MNINIFVCYTWQFNNCLVWIFICLENVILCIVCICIATEDISTRRHCKGDVTVKVCRTSCITNYPEDLFFRLVTSFIYCVNCVHSRENIFIFCNRTSIINIEVNLTFFSICFINNCSNINLILCIEVDCIINLYISNCCCT